MVDRVLGDLPVEVALSGEIADGDRQLALDRIEKLLHLIDLPVLHIDLRMEMAGDPGRERPALCRATLDLNGDRIRAHVSGTSMTEAIDLLEQRLRRRIEQIHEHRRALRRRGPTSPPGEWRHGDLPPERPPWYDRPVVEREIVQHKSFATPAASIDEAVFDLESMDYDFFLFREASSERDAMVHRREDGAYGLRFDDGRDSTGQNGAPPAAAIVVEPLAAPELDLDEAREALDNSPDPWVFFTDLTTRRGRVLYRRYDGHYGLITPVDDGD